MCMSTESGRWRPHYIHIWEGHANWIKLELMLRSSRQCPQLSVVPQPILEDMLADLLTMLLFTERVG